MSNSWPFPIPLNADVGPRAGSQPDWRLGVGVLPLQGLVSCFFSLPTIYCSISGHHLDLIEAADCLPQPRFSSSCLPISQQPRTNRCCSSGRLLYRSLRLAPRELLLPSSARRFGFLCSAEAFAAHAPHPPSPPPPPPTGPPPLHLSTNGLPKLEKPGFGLRQPVVQSAASLVSPDMVSRAQQRSSADVRKVHQSPSLRSDDELDMLLGGTLPVLGSKVSGPDLRARRQVWIIWETLETTSIP